MSTRQTTETQCERCHEPATVMARRVTKNHRQGPALHTLCDACFEDWKGDFALARPRGRFAYGMVQNQ